jgi:hypothetical protein
MTYRFARIPAVLFTSLFGASDAQATVFRVSGFNTELYTTKTAAGKLAVIGSTLVDVGSRNLSGLAFQASSYVPEPGTLALSLWHRLCGGGRTSLGSGRNVCS